MPLSVRFGRNVPVMRDGVIWQSRNEHVEVQSLDGSYGKRQVRRIFNNAKPLVNLREKKLIGDCASRRQIQNRFFAATPLKDTALDHIVRET